MPFLVLKCEVPLGARQQIKLCMFIRRSVRTEVKKRPTITVNQITNSMGLNRFSESNSHSGDQEIPPFCGTRQLFPSSTKSRQRKLSCARLIQLKSRNIICPSFSLILSTSSRFVIKYRAMPNYINNK
jgi:hypothetical protein